MTDFPPLADPTALEALLEETEKDMLLKASQEMVGLCVFFVARRRWRLHALDAGAKRRTLARGAPREARRAPPLTALTVARRLTLPCCAYFAAFTSHRRRIVCAAS